MSEGPMEQSASPPPKRMNCPSDQGVIVCPSRGEGFDLVSIWVQTKGSGTWSEQSEARDAHLSRYPGPEVIEVIVTIESTKHEDVMSMENRGVSLSRAGCRAHGLDSSKDHSVFAISSARSPLALRQDLTDMRSTQMSSEIGSYLTPRGRHRHSCHLDSLHRRRHCFSWESTWLYATLCLISFPSFHPERNKIRNRKGICFSRKDAESPSSPHFQVIYPFLDIGSRNGRYEGREFG